MAFCSKCGAQSEANQRFCVKCGNDLSAGAPPAAAPQAFAPGPGQIPGAIPGPVPVPGQFPPPGAAPIIAMPPAQSKGKGWLWGLIIVGAVLYGLYYIGSHNQPTAGQPGATPAQQPGATPGQQPGATPATAPSGAPQPGTAVQPGDPGPGGPNATLVQLQSFTGSYRGYNGSVQIYDGKWVNRSNVTIVSATLECDQYAANDAVLAQNRTTLNGPVQPGGTGTYNPFLMGAALQYTKYVNCGVVEVTPAQ
jgi:zinc ribbon protein